MAKLSERLKEGDAQFKQVKAALSGVTDYNLQNFNLPAPGELITLGGIVGSSEYFRLSLDQMLEHVLLIGTTGAGKTEMFKRIAHEILFNEDKNLRLYVVDGKGDEEFARTIAVMAHAAGKPAPPIVRIGMYNKDRSRMPSAVFDCLAEGDAETIYEYLVAVLDLYEYKDTADYFRKWKRFLLQRICGVNVDIKEGPPRSFEEVLHRLTAKWLEGKFKDTEDWEVITSRKLELFSFKAEVDQAVRPLMKVLRPGGFTLESHPVIIISVSPSQKQKANTVFRLVGALATINISSRNADNRGYWLLDEFAEVGPEIMATIFRQGRSRGAGVVAGMGTISSMGEQLRYKEEIEAYTNTHILMKTKNAGNLVERAGMKRVQDISVQHKDGVESGTTQRWKEVYRVDPTELSELEKGGAFVVTSDGVTRIRGKMIEDYNASMFDESMEDLSVREDILPVVPAPTPTANSPTTVTPPSTVSTISLPTPPTG